MTARLRPKDRWSALRAFRHLSGRLKAALPASDPWSKTRRISSDCAAGSKSRNYREGVTHLYTGLLRPASFSSSARKSQWLEDSGVDVLPCQVPQYLRSDLGSSVFWQAHPSCHLFVALLPVLVLMLVFVAMVAACGGSGSGGRWWSRSRGGGPTRSPLGWPGSLFCRLRLEGFGRLSQVCEMVRQLIEALQ